MCYQDMTNTEEASFNYKGSLEMEQIEVVMIIMLIENKQPLKNKDIRRDGNLKTDSSKTHPMTFSAEETILCTNSFR